jgi:hypothetical protein
MSLFHQLESGCAVSAAGISALMPDRTGLSIARPAPAGRPGPPTDMPRSPRHSATQLSLAAISESLSAPERALLFCVSSGTEWVRVGITLAVVQHMIVRNLVQRDAAGRLGLTSLAAQRLMQ